MRWKRRVLFSAFFALAAVAGVVGVLHAGLPFRANRILYLKNARRYPEALREYERLREEHPAAASRLPADFRTRLIEDAARDYARPFIRRQEGADYCAFLDLVAARPDLLPLARRKRLDFMVLLDGKSSATLAAAREILRGEGYNPEAYWWTAYNQYDPTRPFTIPGELLLHREAFRRDLASNPQPPTPERASRIAFLSGLLAVADRNWAEAADNLAQYRLAHPELESLDLIQGLALLKSGRPEAAIHHLSQYKRLHPGEPSTLRYLADAWLILKDYPWASQAIDEIRARHPEQEPFVYLDVFGVGGDNPLDRLCAQLRRGAPYEQDVALWAWLDDVALTPGQHSALTQAADEIIAADDLHAAGQAALLQSCLRRGRLDAARRLLAATAPAADTTASLRRLSMESLISDVPGLPAANADATSGAQPLLAREATHHFTLKLRPGASLCFLLVQGAPAGGVWPVVHVNLGDYGAQNFHLGDSRDHPRPLVMALRRPAEGAVTIEGALSLINGGEQDGASRSVRLLAVQAF